MHGVQQDAQNIYIMMEKYLNMKKSKLKQLIKEVLSNTKIKKPCNCGKSCCTTKEK